MQPLVLLVSSAAAFGLASSLHCAAMCGPIAACAAGTTTGRAGLVARYHLGRLLGYALAGAIVGALGGTALSTLKAPGARLIPWALALVLVLQAAGLIRRAGELPLLGPLVVRAGRLAASLPDKARAASLGAITPLLPCGLLWGMYALALASGSAKGGALTLLAFAAGGIPALLFAQGVRAWLGGVLGDRVRWVERGTLLLGAVFLVWRGATGEVCCPP